MEDKQLILKGYEQESKYLLEQIKSLAKDLFDKKTDQSLLDNLKVSLMEKRELLGKLEKEELKLGENNLFKRA